jgi:predicted ATPase/DNA-binding winged helix-turn-helix (wHTH) protein
LVRSQGVAASSETFSFGSFLLMPTRRVLLDNGKRLRLGSRALDILVALVEQAGKTVRKDELIARAWPNTIADEATLRVHIAALRKALGDGRSGNQFIVNDTGRGYAFVAPAIREDTDQLEDMTTQTVYGSAIPAALTRIIGREDIIAALASKLLRHRLVAIVGPGGIGKTTVAAGVADAARASYPDGVWFVGLATLQNPDLVPSALGSVLGLTLPGGVNPVSGLIAWLRDKHALVVLDNCEHLVSTVASLAEEVVKSTQDVSVLVTSREPLRAEGEFYHRLGSLELPPRSTQLTAGEALRYSAVQLFSERAALAGADQFVIDNRDVSAVVEICQRLDGIPLALELAAAHVGSLGVRGLAARLDAHLALRMWGRRTALPRHQTLRATLDWSYDLLSEPERIILRRLAVFRGDFTMDSASEIVADKEIISERVVDGVANLVDKSLVVADIGGDITYYHLLEITRTYAMEKLQESGEREGIMRSHAQYFRKLLTQAGADSAARAKSEWLADYPRHIGNLRAALEWAFSSNGDAALGVALAALATDFWIATSQVSELCDWGFKAVGQLGVAEGTRFETMLQYGLGQALTYSRGMGGEAQAALTRALTLARAQADPTYQYRAIWGLWLFALRVVDFRECLRQSQELELLAETVDDQTAGAKADLLFGIVRYYLGEHTAAAKNLERARVRYPVIARGSDRLRFAWDLPTDVHCYQAVNLWILGFAERSYRAGREAIKEARSVNRPVPLCNSLAAPSSIFLVKMGYLDEAERCIKELLKQSETHSLAPFHVFGLCSKGGLAAARGDTTEAEQLLRLGLQQSREIGYYLFDAFFRGELASVLASSGCLNESLVEIDAALRYAEESESLWCMPEILRLKGEIVGKRSGTEGDTAEEWFIRARDLANRQHALSWELRAAISLARFWRVRHRAADARELLEGVYCRFTEGFDTTDLRAAKELVTELS